MEFYQGFITPTTDLGKKAQQRDITDEAGWVPFAIRDFNKSPHNDLGKQPQQKYAKPKKSDAPQGFLWI